MSGIRTLFLGGAAALIALSAAGCDDRGKHMRVYNRGPRGYVNVSYRDRDFRDGRYGRFEHIHSRDCGHGDTVYYRLDRSHRDQRRGLNLNRQWNPYDREGHDCDDYGRVRLGRRGRW